MPLSAAGTTQPCWALSDRPQGRNFLVHTTNGGRTWTQVLPATSPSTDISFVAAADGFGLGLPADGHAVLTTTDGGRSWRPLATLPSDLRATSMSFVDDLHGWILGTTTGSAAQVEVLATGDGGRTWQVARRLPLPATQLLNVHPYLRLFAGGVGLM